MDSTDVLGTQQILDADLADWRKLAQAFHGRFLTGDFGAGVRFVSAVAEVSEAAGHRPEVRLTEQSVDLKLISRDAVYRPEDGPEVVVSYVTQRDVDLARRISAVAKEQGITAAPAAVTQLELALDTADFAAIGPFWAAVLTGSTDSLRGNDVGDPTGQLPLLWFQDTEPHETPRQRFHLDLWVPPEVAEERIAAAVAAGGRMVDDSEAPSFTVLADPEGNKVCVCTSLDR
ncbi:VOC family protein [Kribbella sancticallisti]|uniref:Putative pterin-4-alpha-carbinolamine dehydratase n=1 Tax=Kribbella sancticallisti TaxID=460087 RepID=A0ABP4QJY3_9ACTN